MATCKSCHAEIIWIKTTRGKSMPCNAEKIEVTAEMIARGRTSIVTENGIVIVCPHVGLVGYVPHFASCPDSDKFRK